MCTELKLFIWTGFSPDYTDGLAFAIAKNEAEAKKQIEAELGFSPFIWGELEVRSLSQRVAKCISGGA